MSQEEFKSIRITLSDEAFERLNKIMKDSSFRNYSSTIEECIRAVYDLISEIHLIAGKRGSADVLVSGEDQIRFFERFVARMFRFTDRTVLPGRK